jgi:hypothetical protein
MWRPHTGPRSLLGVITLLLTSVSGVVFGKLATPLFNENENTAFDDWPSHTPRAHIHSTHKYTSIESSLRSQPPTDGAVEGCP